MTTLRHRAPPWVRALMRVIAGQIRSAVKAHSDWTITDSAVRSVTKRIAGNVAAEWPRLSAARDHDPSAPAVTAREAPSTSRAPSRQLVIGSGPRHKITAAGVRMGGALTDGRSVHLPGLRAGRELREFRAKVKRARGKIGRLAGDAKHATREAETPAAWVRLQVRHETLVEILRLLAQALDD